MINKKLGTKSCRPARNRRTYQKAIYNIDIEFPHMFQLTLLMSLDQLQLPQALIQNQSYLLEELSSPKVQHIYPILFYADTEGTGSVIQSVILLQELCALTIMELNMVQI